MRPAPASGFYIRSALAFCRRRKLVCAVGGGAVFGSIAVVTPLSLLIPNCSLIIVNCSFLVGRDTAFTLITAVRGFPSTSLPVMY
jgi:hypothetical protein